MVKVVVLTMLSLVLASCHSRVNVPVKLIAVKPYSRVYLGPDGARMRRDYFLVNDANRGDRAFRQALRSLVYAHRENVDLTNLKIYGIYVYERTKGLDRSVKKWGELSEGDCKQWVLAGAVWNGGKLTQFDLVENWETVFDLKDDGPIPPDQRNNFDY
jgi:hypothetical protein